jgi:hypothetical protein
MPAVLGRVMDAAHPLSPAVITLGPRSFTALELVTVTEELLSFDTLVNTLGGYVIDHRTAPYGVSSAKADTTIFQMIGSAGTPLQIGSLSLTGIEMVTETTAIDPVAANVGGAVSVDITVNSTAVATLNESTYAVHSFLRHLPLALYNAYGGLIEEITSVYYRGTGPITSITPEQRSAIVRIQSKVTQSIAEQAANTMVFGKAGAVTGGDAFRGRDLSRIHAEPILRLINPILSAWLLDQSPPGTPVLTSTDLGG